MSTIIDDAQLDYSGSWVHSDDGSANLVDGTQSWTSDSTASFTVTFTGTGFDLCAAAKVDRGAFTYVIDGTTKGAGTQLGDDTTTDPECQTVASARNLALGRHSVVFTNDSDNYFGVDAVTIVGGGAAVASSSVSSSSSSFTSSTASSTTLSSSVESSTSSTTIQATSIETTTSDSLLQSVSHITSSASSSATSSIFSSSSSTLPDNSAAESASQTAHSGSSTGKKVALVAGPLAGGVLVLLLAFFLYMRLKRRREEDSLAIAPSASTHYLDEKDGGFFGPTERQGMSFAGRISPGRISPIAFGKSRGHARLNSEMSLESHTEPYQPTALAQPPYVEPYRLPAAAGPSDFAAYRNTALNPSDVPRSLQRQSSYEHRLAAASASLPDWRASKAPSDISRYPSTIYTKPAEADRVSTYSALYEGLMDDGSSDGHRDAREVRF